MDTARGLQEVISRNVRVLMAIHDIRSQQDLAARLGWPPARLNKTLNGNQRWAIDDLPALADAFGVTAAALLGDTTELVGAAGPTAAATSSNSVSIPRSIRNKNLDRARRVIPFPLVRQTRGLYLAEPARALTLCRSDAPREDVTLTGTSDPRVTPLRRAVGL